MSKFLEILQELLQCEAVLDADTYLWDIEEWDSLAIMSCIAWFDKTFGLKTTFSQYKSVGTPADLAQLTRGRITE